MISVETTAGTKVSVNPRYVLYVEAVHGGDRNYTAITMQDKRVIRTFMTLGEWEQALERDKDHAHM